MSKQINQVVSFRFQELNIWKRSVTISIRLFELSDSLEQRKLFRFSEQLRGATLSITNNIAEGSGSKSNSEFRQFLNYSRRSIYEVVNMLLIFVECGYLKPEGKQGLLVELEEISKMITVFSKKL